MIDGKKVIGIDGNEANVLQRVGSNVYAFELLSAMEKSLQKDEKFLVKVFLAEKSKSDMPKTRHGWEYVIVPNAPYWTQWKLPLALRKHKDLDLFFSPGHYLPSFSPVPTVASFMDLAYEFYPSYFKIKDLWQLRILSWWSAKHAKHLLAISESTKKDVVKFYHRKPSDVTVVYPAVERITPLSQTKVADELQKLKVEKPYVLFVGTLQPRKNLVRLIQAFQRLKERGWEGSLVLAGKIGWQADEIVKEMETSVFKNHIHHLGFVDDVQKQALIQGAECLVLPGIYEGFGIPPLEAIQLGTLPVVSNTSSLPEVVGPNGLTFDALNVEDISEKITEVLAMPKDRRQKEIEWLQKYTERFSWEKSAEKVIEVLKEL